MNKLYNLLPLILLGFLGFAWVGSTTAGWDPREGESTTSQQGSEKTVAAAINRLKEADPSLQTFFDQAYGYAIFPTVAKAGIGIGGAYGEGEVYRQGGFIGLASLTQVTIGFQLGGQAYTEIIFFKDKQRLDDFTAGNFELGAQASAIAVTKGISADVDYDNGVAVFTLPKKGLMYEATISGQKFSFEPAAR